MIPEPGIEAQRIEAQRIEVPRIKEPEPNAITRPYRGLSVQEVDIPLTPAAIGDLLSRREIYRRTGYLVLRGHGQTALVAVRPEDPDRLFSPVAELRENPVDLRQHLGIF